MASTPSINIPLLSIPAFYTLALLTHGIALVKVSQRKGLKAHDNRNPKSVAYTETARKRLSANQFAAWERTESCHRNHLENLPLFVAAVFAGLLAEGSGLGNVDVGLHNFVYGWMAIRIAYTVNYIVVETQNWSYLRSILYFWGTGWAFAVIVRSAYVLGK